MSRIEMNVAARPFANNLPWLLALAAGGALGAVLLFSHVWSLAESLQQQAVVQRRLDVQYQDIERSKAMQARAEVDPPRKERERIIEMAEFASGLLKSRAFSWTALLRDLEAVLPPHVRILTINPTNQGRDTIIRMECLARDNAQKLLFFQRLYDAPFDDPYILGETIEEGGELRFNIQCRYQPSTQERAGGTS